MTIRPTSRPLLPVLSRMALGLLLAAAGAFITRQGVWVKPTPGMSTATTPIELPLDGPQPGDLATFAALSLEGDRLDVTVNPLPAGNPMLVQGEVLHRLRNPVSLASERQGGQVIAKLSLTVQPLSSPGVTMTEPEPVQHTATLNLTRGLPLTLSSRTTSGDQRLNLNPLRLRALTVRTRSGDQQVTLPGRPGGPFSLVTQSGDIQVSAPEGSSPEALRVNSGSGDLHLNLAPARLQALGVGSSSGDITLVLPEQSARASVTSSSGDINISAPAAAHGNLDIRTQTGNVTLNVPADLILRVRFTDRDTLTRPSELPSATAPDLDVFVDAPAENFTLRTSGQNVPLPQPTPDDTSSSPARR